MEHIWSVLCSSSSTDSRSNRVSLFDIIEELQLEMERAEADHGDQRTIPFPTSLQLVTMWRRDHLAEPETGRTRTVVEADGEQLAVSGETEVRLDEYARNRVTTQMSGMPINISSSGQREYRFLVQSLVADTWETEASIPLLVTLSIGDSDGGADAEGA